MVTTATTDTNTVQIPEIPARVELWEERKQLLRVQRHPLTSDSVLEGEWL
ncbi:MAG: hypothetical protein M1396_06455 [Chloroflexi bacterium]|nr:hypothetical protein [Chloroflexota bacterium]